MTRKVAVLEQHCEAREGRIRQIREDYGIDAERMAVLVMRYQDSGRIVSYENQGQAEGQSIVPAGVIANLVEEHEMIDNERDQIWKLKLVLRNLADDEMYWEPQTGDVKTRQALHSLTDFELDYLGF